MRWIILLLFAVAAARAEIVSKPVEYNEGSSGSCEANDETWDIWQWSGCRRALLEVSLEMEAAMTQAHELSRKHTEHLGACAVDLLHVASALMLESELFLTTDNRQAQLAKTEGLKVVSVG